MPRRHPKANTIGELIEQLKKDGWTAERNKAGHWKLTSPKGGVVFAGSTPSDFRAIRNVERYLKREGWKPVASNR